MRSAYRASAGLSLSGRMPPRPLGEDGLLSEPARWRQTWRGTREHLQRSGSASASADGAIAEIAELGTAEARAALIEIRAQPSRYLDHQFETDNTDVETGYSPKWVTISRPSSELGEALGGEARARGMPPSPDEGRLLEPDRPLPRRQANRASECRRDKF